MTKRLADHLDRDTTVLGSSSPRMTKRVGSDGEVETQPLCQRLQTVVESSESGLGDERPAGKGRPRLLPA